MRSAGHSGRPRSSRARCGAAERDGIFAGAGALLDRLPAGPRVLYAVALALVAFVTAILNLDTSVFFLTPVLLHLARLRSLDEGPFLYGAVFMSNAGSLFLPGSNLTNLLVLDGARMSSSMLHAWLASCALTATFVVVAFRPQVRAPEAGTPRPFHIGVGVVAVAVAAVLVVGLREPALPVLAVGLCAAAVRREIPRVGVPALAALLAFTVCLGTLARSWHAPAALLASSGSWTTAATSAVASIALNNLPAAVLFSAQPPAHPTALLVGLDLGPNLAVTGSLSAFLWLRAARAVGADASVATYSRLGVLLVPLTIVGALGAS